MAPCLAPVLDEGFEGAAFYAVGEVLDGGADDFVAAPDCEGLSLRVSNRTAEPKARTSKEEGEQRATHMESHNRDLSHQSCRSHSF
jgi:hypothetical protein